LEVGYVSRGDNQYVLEVKRILLDQHLKETLERAAGLLREGQVVTGARNQKLCWDLKAFGYIHNHRVVHRDLKPKNIMVDDQNNMKLIDLGIPSREGANRLTYAGYTQALSTPECVSSEQVKGKRVTRGPTFIRWGRMLHEILSGKTPFSGPSSRGVMHDCLINHPLSRRAWRSRRSVLNSRRYCIARSNEN
jgi:serine/threonine protein kinase